MPFVWLTHKPWCLAKNHDRQHPTLDILINHPSKWVLNNSSLAVLLHFNLLTFFGCLVFQALIHGLNRHYYSIAINYRKNELEEKMLLNLHKKKWTDGLTLKRFDTHSKTNEQTVQVSQGLMHLKAVYTTCVIFAILCLHNIRHTYTAKDRYFFSCPTWMGGSFQSSAIRNYRRLKSTWVVLQWSNRYNGAQF